MKSNKLHLAFLLTIAGVVALIIGCQQVRKLRGTRLKSSVMHATDAKSQEFSSAKAEPLVNREERAAEPEIDPAALEIQSLNTMVDLMKQFDRGDVGSSALYEKLKAEGHQPEISATSNPETGSIVTLTTGNPLYGTRYFKAMFFRGADSEVMNFMTFEFRPGPNAMEEAEAIVKKAFGVTEVASREDDLVVYNIDDNYEVTINKIDQKQLEAEPRYRRYTNEDLGVVEVTLQLRDSE
jgi:hypothetical protein